MATTTHAPRVCSGVRQHSDSSSSLRRVSCRRPRVAAPLRGRRALSCRAEAPSGGGDGGASVEETTRKWGLEAGLWKVRGCDCVHACAVSEPPHVRQRWVSRTGGQPRT